MKKRIGVLIASIVICLLCACVKPITDGELIGIWSASWDYEGKHINTSVEFYRDGTFILESYADNELKDPYIGTYRIENDTVVCKESDSVGKMEFKYDGNSLVNAGHHFTKEN